MRSLERCEPGAEWSARLRHRLRQEAAGEDAILVPRHAAPGEATALLSSHVGFTFDQGAREVLEADREAPNREPVRPRHPLHQRAGGDGDGHAPAYPAGAGQVVHQERQRLRFRQRPPVGIDHAETIGIPIGGEPQTEPLRPANLPRKRDQALGDRIRRYPTEIGIPIAASHLHDETAATQDQVQHTGAGPVEGVVKEADARSP